MRILRAWQKWVTRDALYVVLQLAWWLVDGTALGGLRSAFRGSARCAGRVAVRPRRIKLPAYPGAAL